MTRVGFIGLWIMGGPMAANLVKAGYEVVGYNRSPDKVRALVEAGGKGADRVADAVRDADIVVTMLPDIDASTIRPDVAASLAATGREHGCAYSTHLSAAARQAPPGSVLIDLLFDVQMAKIEFDPDTYEPLPVYKPAATRAQVEKALDLLDTAQRPLIVAGGGIVNADAGDLPVESAELTGVPVVPTLMCWGTIADDHPQMVGMPVVVPPRHR